MVSSFDLLCENLKGFIWREFAGTSKGFFDFHSFVFCLKIKIEFKEKINMDFGIFKKKDKLLFAKNIKQSSFQEFQTFFKDFLRKLFLAYSFNWATFQIKPNLFLNKTFWEGNKQTWSIYVFFIENYSYFNVH